MGSLGVSGTGGSPGGRTASCSVSCTRLADLPGALGVWMEFHPLIILYITTKITQKTTILTGISKLSQSILPSLSTCNVRWTHLTWKPGLRQQENKWRKSANHQPERSRGRTGPTTNQIQKPQKTGILHRSLGVSVNPQRAPGANLSTGYPQLLWITLVEFGSFS